MDFISLAWLAGFASLPMLFFYYCQVSLLRGVFIIYVIYSLVYMARKFLDCLFVEDFHKKAIFITGCDTGFGHWTALACLSEGQTVYAGCLTNEGAAALRAAVGGRKGVLKIVRIDVASDESVKKAAEYIEKDVEKHGGLYAIVNNAGIVGSSFYDYFLTVEEYKEVCEINTLGAIRVTQALKHLVKKTRGRIITVSSICSRFGMMGFGPYTVSKFAISGYCEVLRQEMRYFGVKVILIEPGFFKTPMINPTAVEGRLQRVWNNASDRTRAEYGEEFFANSKARVSELLASVGSTDTISVVKVYVSAIICRYPRPIYQIGNDAKFFFNPMSYLPTPLRDAIIMVIDKASKAPVPAAAVE